MQCKFIIATSIQKGARPQLRKLFTNTKKNNNKGLKHMNSSPYGKSNIQATFYQHLLPHWSQCHKPQFFLFAVSWPVHILFTFWWPKIFTQQRIAQIWREHFFKRVQRTTKIQLPPHFLNCRLPKWSCIYHHWGASWEHDSIYSVKPEHQTTP